MPKNPLVIFVGEAGHGDLAYGSFVKQVAEYSQDKGLKFQIFSEFETQSQKMKGCKERPEFPNSTPFINEPSASDLRDTTAFLDKHFTPIGNLASRNKLLEERFSEFAEQGLTASQVVAKIFQENNGNPVMSPKMWEMLDPEKMTLEALKKEWGAPLHYPQIHREMAGDFREKRSDDTDVIIIVTGFGHSYGIDKMLQEDFEGCQKYAVTNFMKYTGPQDEELRKQIRSDEEKFAPVGDHGLIGFELDPKTKAAIIPDVVTRAIDEKSIELSKTTEAERMKQAVKEAGALDGLTELKIEPMEKQPEKGFVKAMIEKIENGRPANGTTENTRN